jgi:hypothetical protein
LPPGQKSFCTSITSSTSLSPMVMVICHPLSSRALCPGSSYPLAPQPA